MLGLGVPFFLKSCPRAGYSHVLQILQIRAHKPSLCFPQIKMDGETAHLTTACRCVYLYVRMQPSMHVVSMGRGCFYLKRSMTKSVEHGLPPVIFHSGATYVPPTFVITPVPVWKWWGVCVPTAVNLLIPSFLFALMKYQLFINTCLYFMDSTMEFMGGNLYKPVWEIPSWRQILYFFCAQDFMWTN